MIAKPDNIVRLTADEARELARRTMTPEMRARLDATTDEDIARQIAEDPDTAPELDAEWFARARLVRGGRSAAE